LLNDITSAQQLINDCRPILERLMGLDPIIHASFHRVSCELAKKNGEFDAYYLSMMAFLSFSDVGELVKNDITFARELSHDLIVAALLNKRVYNFGDLLGYSDLLNSLQRTDYSFLLDLLDSFNNGDFTSADKISHKVSAHPELSSHSDFL